MDASRLGLPLWKVQPLPVSILMDQSFCPCASSGAELTYPPSKIERLCRLGVTCQLAPWPTCLPPVGVVYKCLSTTRIGVASKAVLRCRALGLSRHTAECGLVRRFKPPSSIPVEHKCEGVAVSVHRNVTQGEVIETPERLAIFCAIFGV